jgi:hypothetical protein
MLRMNDHRVHESEKAGVCDQGKRRVSRVVNWGSIPLPKWQRPGSIERIISASGRDTSTITREMTAPASPGDEWHHSCLCLCVECCTARCRKA